MWVVGYNFHEDFETQVIRLVWKGNSRLDGLNAKKKFVQKLRRDGMRYFVTPDQSYDNDYVLDGENEYGHDVKILVWLREIN